jgi:hypothetical protein
MGKEKQSSRRNSTYLTELCNSDFVILYILLLLLLLLLLLPIYKSGSLEALSKFAKLNYPVHPLPIFPLEICKMH